MTSNYNVLIVDDDAWSLCLLENIINQQDHLTIFKAEDGFAALEIVRKEMIDILVTDYVMPGMDGITLMHECLAIKPSLMVVIQSGEIELATAIEAMRCGAFDFLKKPLDPKRLILSIDKCIDRIQLERKLAEQSNKLRLFMTTIEQSSVSILITDPHGLGEYVNQFFSNTTGYAAEEIIGSQMLESGLDGMSTEVSKDMWNTIQAGQVWKGEIKSKKKNGELFWERTTISPVYNVLGEIKNLTTDGRKIWMREDTSPLQNAAGSIAHFIAIKEDITYEKQLETAHALHEKIRKQEQLRAMNQNKLASLGEIATGIAHEINQPLTFINTLLHTTIERFAKNSFDVAKLTAKFEMAIHQAKRITTIIDHLRTFGRDDEKRLALVEMEAILDNALILMQERIRLRNIVILRKIDKNLPSIIGNSHTLEQIFINFFQNSIDAMQEQGGGKIMISMGHDQGSNEIWLSFADSGPGMTPEVQEKMFEPFFTTKDIGKGTGLGLSLVFGIVRDHAGDIVCHSEPGKGTTFFIALPIQTLKKSDVV